MTYEQALAYISQQGRFAMKLGLRRTEAILDAMGNPHRLLQGVHIAGTNGKGSVAAMIATILKTAGFRVGFMTKPHLLDYTERIQIDLVPIPRERFAALFTELEPLYARIAEQLGPPTEFEYLTSAALYFLAQEAVDLLVCEVGMGGRLDSTNVTDLGVEVITNIGLDHMKHLGATLPEIAGEKAAILKPGSAAITGARGEALDVIAGVAAERAIPLLRLEDDVQVATRSRRWHGVEVTVVTPAARYADLAVPLIGLHQGENAALAVGAVELLRGRGWDVEARHIRTGLARTRWPARLERIASSPALLVDGGHNPPALAALRPAVLDLLQDRPQEPPRRLAVVFGAMADKDLGAMFAELAQLPIDIIAFAPIQWARAATPAQLAARWPASAPARVVAAPSLPEALARARAAAGSTGVVLACGSVYLAGEILALERRLPVPA